MQALSLVLSRDMHYGFYCEQRSERFALGPLLSTTLPARAGPRIRTVPNPSLFINIITIASEGLSRSFPFSSFLRSQLMVKAEVSRPQNILSLHPMIYASRTIAMAMHEGLPFPRTPHPRARNQVDLLRNLRTAVHFATVHAVRYASGAA